MKTWNIIEEHFEKWFLFISLIAMVLIITLQVILRWVGSPTVWAEELARYIMLYQVWVGAAYAVRENAHIRITALLGKFTGRKKLNIELIVLIIWMIFSVWLTVEGIILVQKIARMGQVSAAMQIPMTIPYASVPIGGFLMSLRLLQQLIWKLSGRPDTSIEIEEQKVL